jgi:hypothetical protein
VIVEQANDFLVRNLAELPKPRQEFKEIQVSPEIIGKWMKRSRRNSRSQLSIDCTAEDEGSR